MIQQIKTELSSTRVMTEQEFGDIGNRGWTLIAVIQETYYIPANSDAPCPGPMSGNFCPHNVEHVNGASCTQRDYFQVPAQMTRTKYVMGRDKETVIGEISESLEETARKFGIVKDEYATLKELYERGMKKEVEMGELILSMSETSNQSSIALQHMRMERDGKIETANRLETDLAKLREHLGTAQFEEILKGKD